MLPIPSAPALLDEFLIEIHFIGQEHVSNGALVLVVTVGLERDFFAVGEVSNGVLGFLAVGLAFLRAIDPAEADTFRALVVQGFDSVAVDHSDNSSGEVGGERETCSEHAAKDYDELGV